MRKRSLLFLAPLALGLVMAGLVSTRAADSKEIITFQCRLVFDGAPITTTTTLTFEIWDLESGGDASNLKHDEDITVSVVNGLVSVQLGAGATPLNNVFSENDNLWIAVKQGATDLLGSRIKLTAVPFSMDAQRAQGLWDGSSTQTLAQLDARYVLSASSGGTTTFVGQDATLIIQADVTSGTIILNDDVEISDKLTVNGNIEVVGGEVVVDGVVQLKHQGSEPSVASSHVALYSKNDGKLYYKNSGGSETEVGSGAGGAGGANHLACGFRLSAGSYHSIWDFGDTSTIYLIPFRSNEVWTKDGGSTWTRHTNSGNVTLGLSGLTASRNYDVFVYWNTGSSALALELSSAWNSNNTSRTDSIELVDGVMVKSSDNSRRYVGSIRTISSTQTRDTRQYRYVWSYENQVKRYIQQYYWIGGSAYWTGGSYTEFSSGSRAYLLIGQQQVLHSTGDYLHAQASTALPGWINLGVGYGQSTPTASGYSTKAETVSQVAQSGSSSHFNNINTVGAGAHTFTVLGGTQSGYSVLVYYTNLLVEYWG